eukprot:jgi/Tetstr1/440477/TSEL_028803.t1
MRTTFPAVGLLAPYSQRRHRAASWGRRLPGAEWDKATGQYKNADLGCKKLAAGAARRRRQEASPSMGDRDTVTSQSETVSLLEVFHQEQDEESSEGERVSSGQSAASSGQGRAARIAMQPEMAAPGFIPSAEPQDARKWQPHPGVANTVLDDTSQGIGSYVASDPNLLHSAQQERHAQPQPVPARSARSASLLGPNAAVAQQNRVRSSWQSSENPGEVSPRKSGFVAPDDLLPTDLVAEELPAAPGPEAKGEGTGSPHRQRYENGNVQILRLDSDTEREPASLRGGGDSVRGPNGHPRHMEGMREWQENLPEWFSDTPGVAQVLHMNPSSPEFREQWNRLRQVYSTRHTAGQTASEFQKDTELLSKRLNSVTFQVIHAQKSAYLRYWDALLMLLIAITTLLQPYEVAFTLPPPFRWLNLMMDTVFLADTLLQFNIAFYDNTTAKTVMVHRAIARHYLRTSFTVDLFASLPYQITLWSIGQVSHDTADPGFLTDRTRLWTFLGLLRLLRLARAPRLMSRMEQLYSIDHGMLSIMTFVMQTCLLAHFCACLWGVAPIMQGSIWGPDPDQEHDISHFGRYSYCLYFAVKTLTSVGYGDIYPLTTYERWLSMGFMLCGAYFFGYVIGSITNTVSIRNHAQNFFYETMDKLQAFVEEHQVDTELRTRLRSYFVYRFKSDAGSGVSWNEIFDLMSPSLKQEVAKNTCARWISNVGFFKGCEEDFIVRLSLSLHPETFTPREKIITLGEESNRMFVVRQGVVASEGRIFISGGVIGLDMLTNLYIMSASIRNYEAIALTFSNVMRCDRTHVLEVLDKFPSTSATLRRTIIRHVFRSEIRSYSRAVVHMLTGKRSIHARLMGDPSGREQHYYDKLLELSPESNAEALNQSLLVGRAVAAAAAAAAPGVQRQKSSRRRTSHLLHRAIDSERERGPLFSFEGKAFEMEELPVLLMAEIREMKEHIMQLHAENKSAASAKAAMGPRLGVPTMNSPARSLARQLSNIPALPFRPYAASSSFRLDS